MPPPLPGVAGDDGQINCRICTPGGTALLGLPSCPTTPGCAIHAQLAIKSMCPGCMHAELHGGRGTGRTLQGETSGSLHAHAFTAFLVLHRTSAWHWPPAICLFAPAHEAGPRGPLFRPLSLLHFR